MTTLHRVDLNLLVALDALLAQRSVTRAAEQLCVGQPAMSATLGRLRRLFDDPLLVRDGRGLVPTTFASSIAGPVRQALALMESAVGAHEVFDPATARRTFAVAASDYVTLVLLKPFLASLSEQAPGVRIDVVPVTPGFVDDLRAGRTDLVVAPHQMVTGPGLEHETLFRDRFVVAVDASNTALGDPPTVEELRAVPFVAYDAGALASVVSDRLGELGIGCRVELTAQTFAAVPLLIAGTPLGALVHERLAAAVAGPLGLRLLRPPMPLPMVREEMAWSASAGADAGHRWLRGRLSALAADLGIDPVDGDHRRSGLAAAPGGP